MYPRILIIAFLLLSWSLTKSVSAASIAPSVIDLTGDSGSVLKQEITIINTQTSDTTYYLDTLKFTYQDDESGSPKFIPPEEDHSGLPEWFVFEKNPIIIPANSFAKIPFSVAIPNGTPAGSYFAAITVSETPSEIVASNGTTIQSETAALVLLTVNGETKLAGALLDFQVNPIDTNQIFGSYKYRLQNQGNIYFNHQGKITFKDLLGRTLLSVDVNKETGRVLPGSTRTFDGLFGQENGKNFFTILKHQFSVFTTGPITAQLEVNIGEGATALSASQTFWYIPWEMILILIAALLIVLGFGFLIKRKTK